MPLNIRNGELDRLAARLARLVGVSKTEAVKLALENELRRLDDALILRERIGLLQKRVNARPAAAQRAANAFYDELSEQA